MQVSLAEENASADKTMHGHTGQVFDALN